MKQVIALTALFLCLASTAPGQKRKSTRRPAASPPKTQKTAPPPPPIMGAQVTVATRAGEQITGQVMEFSAYKVRVKQGEMESTVPLESVASMRFGDAAPPVVQPPQTPSHSPDFSRDAESVMALFVAMDSSTKSGIDYGDYGARLVELRRAAERFVSKYAGSEDQAEARLAALFSATVDDYSRARTIWTLKLGQGTGSTVTVTDSPAVADAVELYPELAQLGSRNKLPADKLVAGLWKVASGKVG